MLKYSSAYVEPTKPEDDPEFVALMEEFAKEQQEKAPMPEFSVDQFFNQLPRKMRRKMLKKESFSNRFKSKINKK